MQVRWTLTAKLVTTGLTFLLLALASIGLTLWVTWNLQGSAAAVNEAGRLRMQTYRLALAVAGAADPVEIADLSRRFDQGIELLQSGDPSRPLVVPWTNGSRHQFELLRDSWAQLRSGWEPGAGGNAQATARQTDEFATLIDGFVSGIEAEIARWTAILNMFQLAMMALAIASAVTLMYTSYLLVLSPVARLKRALAAIQQGDLATRVEAGAQDEFGELAAGFNEMALTLQALYASLEEKVRDKTASDTAVIARIDGVALNAPQETLTIEELRQRACTELLRQVAIRDGLLEATDPLPVEGAISEEASEAIDAWLEGELQIPDPSEAACRRHFDAQPARYRTGERVRVRHVLFAVTPGMDVVALRNRAETCLLDVRCHDGAASDRFGRAARELSNCPSGEQGGELGWLTASDCAPEFARELFGRAEVGVLPRLVHSRFGLHVVEVLEREPGAAQSFESVQGAVRMALRQQTYVTALRQCLQVLAGAAQVEGVALDAAETPLVQ